MALETDFVRYANIILVMLQQAAEVNIQTDDEDLIEYINGLREAILEAYTGILQVRSGGICNCNRRRGIMHIGIYASRKDITFSNT